MLKKILTAILCICFLFIESHPIEAEGSLPIQKEAQDTIEKKVQAITTRFEELYQSIEHYRLRYDGEYTKYFNQDFMWEIIHSGDITLLDDLLTLLELKAPSEVFSYFSYTHDPLTMAVTANNFAMVELVLEREPALVKIYHNGEHDGEVSWTVLDCAKNNEMFDLLIKAGANTTVYYGGHVFLRKNCTIYDSIEDAESGNGKPGEEDIGAYASERIFVFNQKEQKYLELYKLTTSDSKEYFYAPVQEVEPDSDLWQAVGFCSLFLLLVQACVSSLFV